MSMVILNIAAIEIRYLDSSIDRIRLLMYFKQTFVTPS